MKTYKNTHKHHIIPRHMGGTDDPSNLIELTVEEHAEAHHKLYKQSGCPQDLIAWKMLSGQITSDDARRLAAAFVMRTKTKEKNSQWGARWYNNGEEEKKVRVGETPPENWYLGRVKKPPSRKGVDPWNKGKNDYLTDELRVKFGNGHRGKKNPDQSKRMIGKKLHEGYKHSDETKKIMSLKKIGNKNRSSTK